MACLANPQPSGDACGAVNMLEVGVSQKHPDSQTMRAAFQIGCGFPFFFSEGALPGHGSHGTPDQFPKQEKLGIWRGGREETGCSGIFVKGPAASSHLQET